MKYIIIIFIIFLSTSAFAARHNVWKYKEKYVREGDSAAEVIVKWGKPHEIIDLSENIEGAANTVSRKEKNGDIVSESSLDVKKQNKNNGCISILKENLLFIFILMVALSQKSKQK